MIFFLSTLLVLIDFSAYCLNRASCIVNKVNTAYYFQGTLNEASIYFPDILLLKLRNGEDEKKLVSTIAPMMLCSRE